MNNYRSIERNSSVSAGALTSRYFKMAAETSQPGEDLTTKFSQLFLVLYCVYLLYLYLNFSRRVFNALAVADTFKNQRQLVAKIISVRYKIK